MVHKRLVAPSSGAQDKWYGIDHNNLVDNLEARSVSDPINCLGDVFSGVSWGAYMPTNASTDIGMLAPTTTSGTQTNGEDADGYFRQHATGATSGTVAGKKRDTTFGRRENNIFCQFRFTISNTSSACRNCHGLTTDTNNLTNTDTFLANADSGVLIGFRTTDANWTIFNNDGTGAMSTLSLGVPKDTLTHRVEIRANNALNGFIVRFDLLTPILLTAKIPAATTPLTMRHQIINATATDINLKMRGIMIGNRKI